MGERGGRRSGGGRGGSAARAGIERAEGDAVAPRSAEPASGGRGGRGSGADTDRGRRGAGGRDAGVLAQRGAGTAGDQRIWADGDGSRLLHVRSGPGTRSERGGADR